MICEHPGLDPHKKVNGRKRRFLVNTGGRLWAAISHYQPLQHMILNPSSNTVPQVTIITAVYNAEKYLNDCIKSVQNQSYKDFEYIIIDGGSTDGTVDIIKQHHELITCWISEPDRGIYDAWNKGLSLAKGKWITFIGADDLLYPDALQTYIQHIVAHPRQHELEFVSSRIELVHENLLPIRTVGDAWVWERFRKEMCTWHVGTFHSINLFTKYGKFDPAYKSAGDYELLMRPKDKLIASFINQTTVKMRLGGISSVQLDRALDETYNAKIKNGLISPIRGQIFKFVDKFRLYIRQATGSNV